MEQNRSNMLIYLEKTTININLLNLSIRGVNEDYGSESNIVFKIIDGNIEYIILKYSNKFFSPLFQLGNYYCQYLKGSPLVKRSNLSITEKLNIDNRVEFLIVGRSKDFVEGVLKKFNDENHTDFYLKKFETGENFVSTIEGKKIAYEDIFYLGIFYWRELENYDRENPITYIDI